MGTLTKCKFCITRNGGYKYVAGNLVGGMGNCGKCNGQITDVREAILIKKYYEEDRSKYESYLESVKKLIEQDSDNIKILEEYITENKPEKSVKV